jgi:hypothetical protein
MAKKSFRQILSGEWSWEKYIPGIFGIACLLEALITTEGLRHLIRDGAFQSGLIFILGAYLSELRYRLLKDVRND